MKTAYSCFVDGKPKFEWQATLLCSSLISRAEVDPDDIRIHVHRSVSDAFREVIASYGASFAETDSFDSTHGFCNKIQQTQTGAFDGYDRVVLCDCDTFILEPVSIDLQGAAAMGRPVDRPNPPLPLLEEIYAAADLTAPDVVPVGVPMSPDEVTFATNWNGGFYVLDASTLPQLGEAWARLARYLLDNHTELLGRHFNHVDQISFAMALDEQELTWRHLAARYNVPTHLPRSNVASLPSDPAMLHYHTLQDHLGRLGLAEDPSLTPAISRANEQILDLVGNRLLSDRPFRAVFERFQASTGDAGPERLSLARESFRNSRYLRHSSRRLEHLASLQLGLEHRTVVEFGAGVGEHSQFFLDRGCSVVSVEPREENTALMRQRHADPDEHLPARNHIVLRASAGEALRLLRNARFQIVYNYGLLYHMADPEDFLRSSARLCEGLYLLETAVNDLAPARAMFSENTDNLTNAIDAQCRLLSRSCIFNTLREVLPYVYVPRRQPAHEQFPHDWTAPARPGRHRAIFVGSVTPLECPTLSPELLLEHEKPGTGHVRSATG